jgi:hypothetical protein
VVVGIIFLTSKTRKPSKFVVQTVISDYDNSIHGCVFKVSDSTLSQRGILAAAEWRANRLKNDEKRTLLWKDKEFEPEIS